MLTNVYYYGVYQPYIIKRSPGSAANAYRKSQRVGAEASGNLAVTKNNAVKTDVTRYAREICKNITEMKDSSRYLCYNASSYFMNVLNESFDTAKDWAVEDLSSFVNAYNAAVSFGITQEHSPELAEYAKDIMDIVGDNAGTLGKAGIYVMQDRYAMSFDSQLLQDKDYLDFGQVLTEVGQVSEAIYGRTRALLEMPISNHMDFKQLSYYYNYSIDRLKEESRNKKFSMLNAGIIVDKVI